MARGRQSDGCGWNLGLPATVLAFSTAHVMTVDEFRTLTLAERQEPRLALAA